MKQNLVTLHLNISIDNHEELFIWRVKKSEHFKYRLPVKSELTLQRRSDGHQCAMTAHCLLSFQTQPRHIL